MTNLKAHIDQANSEREFYRESIASASSVTVDSDYSFEAGASEPHS